MDTVENEIETGKTDADDAWKNRCAEKSHDEHSFTSGYDVKESSDQLKDGLFILGGVHGERNDGAKDLTSKS